MQAKVEIGKSVGMYEAEIIWRIGMVKLLTFLHWLQCLFQCLFTFYDKQIIKDQNGISINYSFCEVIYSTYHIQLICVPINKMIY